MGSFGSHVSINKCLTILVVHYQVKVAITVKVTICCPVAETWRIKAKRHGFIFKLEILLIYKAVTGNACFRHFLEESFRFKPAVFYLVQHFLATKVSQEILVGQVSADAVAYKNIF